MPRKIINIITPHYFPENTAASHRMEAVAKTLSFSFRVHVFTLTERGRQAENQTVKYDENLTVNYVPVPAYNKSVFFIRAFFEWWYSRKLIKTANENQADLAIVTIPFMFLLPLCAKYCKAKKRIADVRDLVWHYLPVTSFLNRLIRNRMTTWMHRSLRQFDVITVTNESEKNWLVNNAFIDQKNIHVISNGVNLEMFSQLSSMKCSPHPKKFTITYIGNVGSSQRFYTLLDALKDMNDVQLNLVGDGNELEKIKAYISLKAIKNVFVTGKLNRKRVAPYYQTSDLLFASLKDEFNTAIPSKLYEYLSTGLPVLYQGRGVAASLLSKFENAFVYNGSDASMLENIIWKIKKLNPDRSEKNIQLIGKSFIREKLSARFIELSVQLLNEKTLSNVFVEDILYSTEY